MGVIIPKIVERWKMITRKDIFDAFNFTGHLDILKEVKK